jgi:serine/threonine protein kinase
MLRVGDRVGAYDLLAEIGTGGMGRVFRARRRSGHEDVAVKVIRESLSAEAEHTRRFLREARAMQEVAHPNVIDILDVGADGDQHYLVMPLLEGASLDRVMIGAHPLPLAMVKRWIAEAAAGLGALHGVGLVHRDIKPSNLMVGAEGETTLMDLGLAKRTDYSTLTAPDRAVGTIAYVAPELIQGDQATPATDVYALACTAFEAVTGSPPFTGTLADVAYAHRALAPPRAHAVRRDVPTSVSDVLGFGLAKEPKRRPPTAKAFATMLTVALRP